MKHRVGCYVLFFFSEFLNSNLVNFIFQRFVPNPEKEFEGAKAVIVRTDNAMTKEKEDT